MLVKEMPISLVKPYAGSRTKNHVQTIAFIQLVQADSGSSKALELALVENVVASRNRNDGGKWSKWVKDICADFDIAQSTFLSRIGDAELRGFRALTSTGVFLPMNGTDLKHFRTSQTISRAALDYGSSLFDNIAAWYIDEKVKAASASTPPPTLPSSATTGAGGVPPGPASFGSSMPKPPSPADGAAAGDPFAKELLELEKALGKVTDTKPST